VQFTIACNIAEREVRRVKGHWELRLEICPCFCSIGRMIIEESLNLYVL